MIEVNNNCRLIICVLILISIFSITLFLNWYANYQTNKKVVRQWINPCKINRYEKEYYEGLGIWQIKDRLSNKNPIVIVCNLPEDVAEEIVDYSLKLIEEKTK